MKLRDTVVAMALAFPFLASAQSSAQLQSEIEILKAQVKELQDLIRGKAAAPTVAEAPPAVELEEFNRIKTKVEAADDVSSSNGMKGLRISGGIDPVYIWNQNKNTVHLPLGITLRPSTAAVRCTPTTIPILEWRTSISRRRWREEANCV